MKNKYNFCMTQDGIQPDRTSLTTDNHPNKQPKTIVSKQATTIPTRPMLYVVLLISILLFLLLLPVGVLLGLYVTSNVVKLMCIAYFSLLSLTMVVFVFV